MRPPPYLERLALEKPVAPPEFDLESELRNICIKVPLLHAIIDIHILTKIIRDLCIKKPRRKRKQPTTIQVRGETTALMTNHLKSGKYANPRNPIITAYINKIHIPNTLIDQGAAINIMVVNTME